MENKKYFFAIDLGATSGRTIVGSLAEGKIEQEELTRFNNNLIETGGHVYWDIYALYSEINGGLKVAAKRGIEITSIGIDTWGCDFLCIGGDGAVLRNPLAYRDPHTVGMMEKYFDEAVAKQTVYAKTGIQFMNFNSLFQLYAMRKAGNVALENADKILFIPDALSYMLTGNAICEYTVASTSQILNPMTGDLDNDLVESLGLKREQFGKMAHPATIIGTLTEEVQQMTGLKAVPVIAVAGHDTASAVAAVPAKNEEFAYLSSGTWSLMGIETKNAIINEKSYEPNFTNEGGIEGTTRFLKNITGMWLLERCRATWKRQGKTYSYDELTRMAKESTFDGLINPDDPAFANPEEMMTAIAAYCQAQGEAAPQSDADYVRCIFRSLAHRYGEVLAMLKAMSPFPIECLHVIGGGSQNALLNQWTADAIGMPVIAGPSEATAIGNCFIQAKAAGLVGDRWEMRRLIAETFTPKIFYPSK